MSLFDPEIANLPESLLDDLPEPATVADMSVAELICWLIALIASVSGALAYVAQLRMRTAGAPADITQLAPWLMFALVLLAGALQLQIRRYNARHTHLFLRCRRLEAEVLALRAELSSMRSVEASREMPVKQVAISG